MAATTPRRLPIATAVLSAVSIGIVFAAAGGLVPSGAVPRAPDGVFRAIPTVNVCLSLGAIVAILVGWRAIRRGNVGRHRFAMGVAVALFVTFLALYLYRLVALGGPTTFEGPTAVYRYVYLPVLAVHVGLAVLCIPLVYYALGLALTSSVRELRRTPHARVGRVAAPLWLTSFAMGVVVYLLVHVVY